MDLAAFVRESNFIEGILRPPTETEIKAHEELLTAQRITISSLVQFLDAVQPDAILRTMDGMDVVVGPYRPPTGGAHIIEALSDLLDSIHQQMDEHHIFMAHYLYENLHPFTDGNGRSGRALWLWMMGGKSHRLFLHEWYYQSLRVHIQAFEPHPNLWRRRYTPQGFPIGT